MNLYVREDVPAGTLVAVNVSGTAPFPSGDANGRTDQGPQGRDAQESGGESGGATIQAVPGRVGGLEGALIGLFALVFGVLAFLLAREPGVAICGARIGGATRPAG